jgi:hypothetical protein
MRQKSPILNCNNNSNSINLPAATKLPQNPTAHFAACAAFAADCALYGFLYFDYRLSTTSALQRPFFAQTDAYDV